MENLTALFLLGYLHVNYQEIIGQSKIVYYWEDRMLELSDKFSLYKK